MSDATNDIFRENLREIAEERGEPMSEKEEMKSEREVWLQQFGKLENEVYRNQDGEYIFVEVEREGNDGETTYEMTRQNLPESIQTRNINL